jgi:hypothetical protein
MSPVFDALQVVVVVQVLQGLALLVGIVYLARRLKAVAEEIVWRDRAQVQPLAGELCKLDAAVRGARAEAATYLEAVFTGVRGISNNLDAARVTAAETLDELRRQPAHPATPARPPPFSRQQPELARLVPR